LRKAIEDAAFRQRFETDDAVRQRWPVIVRNRRGVERAI
jgi:hypothetical protein